MKSNKELLDLLLGYDRDRDTTITQKKFTDNDVCKYYLCGLCPEDLFTNSKTKTGCGKLHLDILKKKYEDTIAKEGRHFGYEYSLLNHLRRLDEKNRRTVEQNKRNLDKRRDVFFLLYFFSFSFTFSFSFSFSFLFPISFFLLFHLLYLGR